MDLFRGITMFLLIGESTRLYTHIRSVEDSSFMQFIGTQLSHHEWNGLYFWDLIQPFLPPIQAQRGGRWRDHRQAGLVPHSEPQDRQPGPPLDGVLSHHRRVVRGATSDHEHLVDGSEQLGVHVELVEYHPTALGSPAGTRRKRRRPTHLPS